MGIQAPAEVKFRLIQEAAQQEGNQLTVSALCKLAGVSRSGYYTWVNAASRREDLEEKDRADFALIRQAYEYRGYPKSAREIYMRLLHLDPPVVMNPKKIRRLMEKYGLVCTAHRENPYPRLPLPEETGAVPGIRQCFLCDITALPYPGGAGYFSSVMDVRTREILVWDLSETPQAEFLLQTVAALLQKPGAVLDDEVIVHSCRGSRLTARAFTENLRSAEFLKSLTFRKVHSRKSFFCRLEEELSDRLSRCCSLQEIRLLLTDWVDYTNNDRCQWELKLLSPREYAAYLQTGVSPITQGISKNPQEWINIRKEGVCFA